MNHISFVNKVVYNKYVFSIYNFVGSIFVNLLKLFIKPDPKLILFVSFGGRRYDDSPQVLFENMIKDARFADYKFVWAFLNPSNFHIEGAETIKIDTLKYYISALKARVWITNSAIERGLSFKGKNTLYVNTWHGSAIKKMGIDIHNDSEYSQKSIKYNYDIMSAQGTYDVDIFSRVFGVPRENFRITGLPRNDELVICNTEANRSRIRKKLGIVDGKKVILYAPTFREYEKDSGSNCVLLPPIDLLRWEHELGDEYVLLIRAHYEVVKVIKFDDNDFVKNVSNYPNLNELMIVSDILVSDYSSIFFDYSIQDKAMLCFAYDYDKYASKRGMYFDIREKLEGNSDNEIQLISNIKNLNMKKAISTTHKFRNEFVEAYGNASLRTIDIIWNTLTNN